MNTNENAIELEEEFDYGTLHGQDVNPVPPKHPLEEDFENRWPRGSWMLPEGEEDILVREYVQEGDQRVFYSREACIKYRRQERRVHWVFFAIGAAVASFFWALAYLA